MRTTVWLLHGLYTGPWIMRALGRRLSAWGWQVCYYRYRSVHHNPGRQAAGLAAALNRQPADMPLYLVGHSLGGLVLRHWAAHHATGRACRCVTLGTPHQGSMVAQRLHHRLPVALGRAYAGALDGMAPPWPPSLQWGSIAGTDNRGAGRLLGGVAEGDGTVSVAETRLAGGRHHLCLPVNHTGMLFDAEVARQVDCFLCHGRFDASDQ